MKSIGYARVSTSGQTLNAQLEQLTAAGCDVIYREIVSGARSDRAELKKALAALGAGDVLIVTRLDRLARSTRDLLDTAHGIEAKGAQLRSLAESWADTSSPSGRLIMTVLAGLAEFERTLIHARTSEGRARAKAAGRPLGRKPILDAHRRSNVLEARAAGMTNADIARDQGVSRSTISRVR